MNLKRVGEEAQSTPAGRGLQVCGDESFELSLVESAAPDAAGQVPQHLARVSQAGGDAALREPLPQTRGIAVGRQSRRDGRGRNAVRLAVAGEGRRRGYQHYKDR